MGRRPCSSRRRLRGTWLCKNQVEFELKDKSKHVLEADHVSIATDGYPIIFSGDKISGALLSITSDDFFELKEGPKRAAVISAGHIAIELAGIFNALGMHTHLHICGDVVPRTLDETIQQTPAPWVTKTGVNTHYRTHVMRVEHQGQLADRVH